MTATDMLKSFHMMFPPKITKLKKADIIQAIVVFEHNAENCEIVMRRQQLWHYLEELKSDKFMKRFVLSA